MLKTNIKGVNLRFKTSNELFSPRNIDHGTLAMLSIVNFKDDDKVLDLGCGYGVVGILASKLIKPEKVVMIDKNKKAVEISKENAIINGVEDVIIYQSDGLKNLDQTGFSLILSNPPYHADFSVPKRFIEKGFNRLKIGGKMFMVTKRKKWYKKKMISIFGGVRIREINDYFVFMSIKKSSSYANK